MINLVIFRFRGYFCHFFGFWRYFGNFKVLGYFGHFFGFLGYFGHFVGFVVILVILKFWGILVIFEDFRVL